MTVGAEKYALQRLEALAHSRTTPEGVPAVLFLCVHNAGRSQMALGWFNHLLPVVPLLGQEVRSPDSELNPDVVKAMAEVGIDISQEFPKPWTDEFLGAADVVVTMGCGDACPLVPGKRYEDWELEDPTGKSLEEIRPIREAVKGPGQGAPRADPPLIRSAGCIGVSVGAARSRAKLVREHGVREHGNSSDAADRLATGTGHLRGRDHHWQCHL